MRLFFAFAVLIGISACADSSTAIKGNDLHGKWEVTEARRNGKLTRTFSNAYFQFVENGEMNTNYSGEMVSGAFEVQQDEIIHTAQEMQQIYKVADWADSSFVMNFEFQGFKFEFLLNRIEE